MKRFPSLALAAFILGTSFPAYAAQTGDILIEKPFLKEGDNCIGMILHNKGKEPDSLIKAASKVAGKIVLIDQRAASEVQGVNLDPGQKLDVKRGVVCLIMRDVREAPKGGTSFPLELTFAKATPVSVDVQVEALPKPAEPVKPAEATAPEKASEANNPVAEKTGEKAGSKAEAPKTEPAPVPAKADSAGKPVETPTAPASKEQPSKDGGFLSKFKKLF